MSKHFQIVKLELEAVLKLEKWDELDDLFEQCWRYKITDRYETLADLVLVIHSCLVKANVEQKYQRSTCAPGIDWEWTLILEVEVLSVLDKIIKLTSRQSGMDIVKLSRWIRCLFNLALSVDENISYRCTEEATDIAAKHHGVSTLSPVHQGYRIIIKPRQDFVRNAAMLNTRPTSSDALEFCCEADCDTKETGRYPPTELEWLATTAFNHAVDYYLQEDDKLCKKWAEQAFILAQWLEDNGALRDLLMEKYASLKLQA